MSSIFSISSVTNAGIAAMQEALDHGYTMVFTAMKTGNGVYTTGEDVTGRTALKSLKNTYTIGSIEEDTDGATVSAVFTNYDGVNILVAEDYKINEIGLFCTVNSVEYLYALAAVPNDDGMEMPAYDVDAENLTQFIQEWYVANSNHANIAVNPVGAYIPVTDIVDNLTSTSTTQPLSAKQGKLLNDEVVKAYKTDDTAETDIADGDYFPFYDSSASAKKKTLWSNIKNKLKSTFLYIYHIYNAGLINTDNGFNLSFLGDDDRLYSHSVNRSKIEMQSKADGSPYQYTTDWSMYPGNIKNDITTNVITSTLDTYPSNLAEGTYFLTQNDILRRTTTAVASGEPWSDNNSETVSIGDVLTELNSKIAVVEYNIPSGTEELAFAYPEGYNQNNCVVAGAKCFTGSIWVDSSYGDGNYFGNVIYYGGINFGYKPKTSGASTKIRFIFMKI